MKKSKVVVTLKLYDNFSKQLLEIEERFSVQLSILEFRTEPNEQNQIIGLA